MENVEYTLDENQKEDVLEVIKDIWGDDNIVPKTLKIQDVLLDGGDRRMRMSIDFVDNTKKLDNEE